MSKMEKMPAIDLLAIGPHPDDIELGCGGTLAKLVQKGLSAGMVDLTRGEMGSRGTPEERLQEAQAAMDILGAAFRVNLELADGQIENSPQNREKLIALIRSCRPSMVFLPYHHDRHPDHFHASKLATEACFYAGVSRVAPDTGAAYRPKRLIYYQISYELPASFYVDISDHFETKLQAIRAHRSQFYNAEYEGEQTFISSKDYFDAIEFRARHYGWKNGVKYAEPFWVREPLLLEDLPGSLTRNQM